LPEIKSKTFYSTKMLDKFGVRFAATVFGKYRFKKSELDDIKLHNRQPSLSEIGFISNWDSWNEFMFLETV